MVYGEHTHDTPPRRRAADEVLLVYNANSPISRSVAGDYASRRKVKNVIAIRCADSAVNRDNETLPLATYRDAVEKPDSGISG